MIFFRYALGLGGLLTFISCGQEEEIEIEEENISEEMFFLTGTSEKMFCPEDYNYDLTYKLCLQGDKVMGPFTPEMIEKCTQWGGGAACQQSIWSKNFAQNIRGKEECMPGTSHNTQGLCVNQTHAFGPFTEDHVESCKAKGGGESCETMRWTRSFAEWSFPQTQPQEKYTFPYSLKATASYTVDPRRFGAGRANGRKHAGADLYAPVGRNIYAVGDGKVIDFHYFYDSTYALVVDHGDFVIRYGEVKSNLPSGIKIGASIKRGQLIAYVGHLKSLNMSMLHFERFSKTKTGPLTVRENWPYQRRSDLVNPTQELILWKYPR